MELTFCQGEWFLSFIINFCVISIAQQFKLLTKLGWLHAGILGTILLGSFGLKGWIAVAIYLLLGSLVTKIGFSYKKAKGLEEARDGSRGPENVWGSAATGAVVAILYGLIDGADQNLFYIAFASSFSAKLADTFGSEIGKTYGKKAFLITNFKVVPTGTDGAISLEGTLASLFGAFVMSSIMFLLSFLTTFEALLIVIASGFLATLFESLVGAILQKRIRILTNEVVNFVQTTFASILSVVLALNFS